MIAQVLLVILSASALPVHRPEISAQKIDPYAPAPLSLLEQLKKDIDKYTSNIKRWQDIKTDLQDLGNNLTVDWFNHLRTKLGLPMVKPGSVQDKKLRKAFADRTVPHIDNQIAVLNRRREKTEKDITRYELDFVELSQAQIQREIDDEILTHFEQIAEDEIKQILKDEMINWSEYETVKRTPERSHGDWTVLGNY